MSQMTVLVTGGAGFIGSHIVDRLLQEGLRPCVVDDLSTGKIENLASGVPFCQIDVTDKESLEKVFEREKPEVVCHHAAQMDVRKSMRDPCFDANVNIIGSLNVIDLSIKYGVHKLIHASTSAVYPEMTELPAREDHPADPVSAYGIAKQVVEKYLKLYAGMHGLRFAALRYGNVFGPRQNPHGEAGVIAIFTQQLLSGIQPTIFGDGSKTRDYIYVDDVVQANIRAISSNAVGVFNVGWGREVSDYQVFDEIRKALHSQVEPVYKATRAGELARVSLDSNRAIAELGWEPRVPFEEGIVATVDYHRANSVSNQSK